MKTEPVIRVSVATHGPILVAQQLYDKWSKIPFGVDLADYLQTGVVVSRPSCFAMAKLVDLAPYDENGARIGEVQPAWFIRCAVGNIFELLSLFYWNAPRICFCRRGEDRMRVYDMPRFLRLVKSTKGRK